MEGKCVPFVCKFRGSLLVPRNSIPCNIFSILYSLSTVRKCLYNFDNILSFVPFYLHSLQDSFSIILFSIIFRAVQMALTSVILSPPFSGNVQHFLISVMRFSKGVGIVYGDFVSERLVAILSLLIVLYVPYR